MSQIGGRKSGSGGARGTWLATDKLEQGGGASCGSKIDEGKPIGCLNQTCDRPWCAS